MIESGNIKITDEFTFASDINFDGKINNEDLDLLKDVVYDTSYINQIERKVIKN